MTADVGVDQALISPDANRFSSAARHSALRNISITVRTQATLSTVPAPPIPALTLVLVSFTVGFDLDMTLIDPRAGMVEVFDVLAAEIGHPTGRRARSSPGWVRRCNTSSRGTASTRTTIDTLVQRYRDADGAA